MKKGASYSNTEFSSKIGCAVIIALALTSGLIATRTDAAKSAGSALARDGQAQASSLTLDQKIAHLLNRLGYGPRPGDIEQARQIGIDRYIDLQLHPEKIDDSAVEQKLQHFETLRMDTAELLAAYPPAQVLRRELGIAKRDTHGSQKRLPELSEDEREKLREEYQSPQKNSGEDAGGKAGRRLLREMAGAKRPVRVVQELQAQKLIRAVESNRQLQEVMVDFWINHFNIYAGKGADRWMLTSYERDVIRPRALGKFKDLLLATAKSPAMLFYLDNWRSTAPNAQLAKQSERRYDGRGAADPFKRGRNNPFGRPSGGPTGSNRNHQRDLESIGQMFPEQIPREQRKKKAIGGLNENYARELMELHTLGVDGGYTQADVTQVARCFTGWSIQSPRERGGYVFRAPLHDNGEKAVLGKKIHDGGMKDGEKVIEMLASHPSTARFLATKLCRRFVADNPPRALVDRAAKVFTRTDGDIREVVRTILTSPEFFAAESFRAKIKTPLELVASSIRAVGGSTDGSPRIHQYVQKLGMPLYGCQPPTGYSDNAEAWVNTGALLERLNFEIALSSNRILGTPVDLASLVPGTSEQDGYQLADRFGALVLQNDISPSTRSTIEHELETRESRAADSGVELPSTEKAKVVALLLGSPEFQRR